MRMGPYSFLKLSLHVALITKHEIIRIKGMKSARSSLSSRGMAKDQISCARQEKEV